MTIQSHSKTINGSEREIIGALEYYQAAHPSAQIETYEQNPVSIRIRIIDPDFRSMDRVERDSLVWKTLDVLSEDVRADITFLLLLTPEEVDTSFVNREFEHPIPSRL